MTDVAHYIIGDGEFRTALPWAAHQIAEIRNLPLHVYIPGKGTFPVLTKEGKVKIMSDKEFDIVSRPRHYNIHPSGVEVIEVIREMNCPDLGNAWKYIARHEHKDDPIQDLEKAVYYIEDEEKRRSDWKFGHRGVQVVVIIDPGYVEAYAPFYRYVDGEPDAATKKALIDIWDADKVDMQDPESRLATNELQRAKRFCLDRIEQLKEQKTVTPHSVATYPAPPVAPIEFSTAKVIRPEPTDTIARSVGHNRDDYIGQELYTEDGWIQIQSIRVTRGGIVWITTADDTEYRFKPRDVVTTVESTSRKEIDA